MAEHGFRFGDHEYEIHVRAQPYVTGGTAYTASVYRIDGRDLQTMSEDEMTASSEDAAVERATKYLQKETGFDGVAFDLPDRKSPRVIKPAPRKSGEKA